MYQFTTPSIVIRFPDSVSVGDIDSLAVTVKQGSVSVEKTLNEVGLDTSGNTITVNLSQAETGRFEKGQVQVQCHILIGESAYATNIMRANMFENLHGEVLT